MVSHGPRWNGGDPERSLGKRRRSRGNDRAGHRAIEHALSIGRGLAIPLIIGFGAVPLGARGFRVVPFGSGDRGSRNCRMVIDHAERRNHDREHDQHPNQASDRHAAPVGPGDPRCNHIVWPAPALKPRAPIAIQTAMASIIRFSVRDTKPSGTLLEPPTQAHLS